MTFLIGVVSQKGGQGKDALTRGLAVEAARSGLAVEVVDMDVAQGSTFEWAQDRAGAGLKPDVPVRLAPTLEEALAGIAPTTDLVIVVGPARADMTTLALARQADLVVQPVGASLDDLRPAVRAFNALVAQGVPASRLLMALSRIGSPAEATAARRYLESAGYQVAKGCVPEKVSYRTTQNAGGALTEARHPTLRAAASEVLQSIINQAINASQEAA